MDLKTDFLINEIPDVESPETKRPTIFVCQDKRIAEYRLSGRQKMGRPEEDSAPDIPVYGKFVSRNHGIFETSGEHTVYHVEKTTNGIKYNGELAEPGTVITLIDGDEFIIPAAGTQEGSQNAVIIYAATPARVCMWRDLQLASRDKLTGLCNREDFIIWWGRNHNAADYRDSALFIMDVDDFKQVNDKQGHNAGDKVLKIVADELKSVVRYENQVCRWGGDEFVGVIPGPADSADARLRKLSSQIKIKTEESGIPVTVSIGYVFIHARAGEKEMDSVVELADKALYSVKQAGKGGVRAYD